MTAREELLQAVKEHIERIELEAWKQGMTDAAAIVGDGAILQKHSSDWGILLAKHNEIIKARNEVTKAQK